MTGKPEPVTVAELLRNKRERLLVRLDEYAGTSIFQLRVFYLAPDGRLLAGRKGLEIGIQHLPALVDALQSALAIAVQTGRLPAT